MKMNELNPRVSTRMHLTKIMLNKKASCKNIPTVHINDSISININNGQNNSKYCKQMHS